MASDNDFNIVGLDHNMTVPSVPTDNYLKITCPVSTKWNTGMIPQDQIEDWIRLFEEKGEKFCEFTVDVKILKIPALASRPYNQACPKPELWDCNKLAVAVMSGQTKHEMDEKVSAYTMWKILRWMKNRTKIVDYEQKPIPDDIDTLAARVGFFETQHDLQLCCRLVELVPIKDPRDNQVNLNQDELNLEHRRLKEMCGYLNYIGELTMLQIAEQPKNFLAWTWKTRDLYKMGVEQYNKMLEGQELEDYNSLLELEPEFEEQEAEQKRLTAEANKVAVASSAPVVAT